MIERKVKFSELLLQKVYKNVTSVAHNSILNSVYTEGIYVQ